MSEGGLDRFRRRNLTWSADPDIELGATLVTDGQGRVWRVGTQPPRLRDVEQDRGVPGAPAVTPYATLDPQGNVWLASVSGVFRWRDGRFTSVRPPPEFPRLGRSFDVIAMTGDTRGRLWVATQGYGMYTLTDGVWTHRSKPDWAAIAARTTSDDRVWLAYRDSLAVIEGDGARTFSKADGLDVSPLVALGTRGREIWAGGERGVAVFSAGRFHRVRFAGGIEIGTVSSIVGTADGVWLGTSTGIVHLPAEEADRVVADSLHLASYQLLDVAGELPEPLLAVNLSRLPTSGTVGGNGILWFLTMHGIAKVDPRLITRNPVVPPVEILSVTADDSTWTPDRGGVTIPALTRTLRIDYTALSLANPDRVRFRSWLQGWEPGWHEPGTRREAQYTDLAPGTYTFHVTASNNDGVWNDAGVAMRFTVRPAWFQTWWFRTGLALTVIALAVAFYDARVRRVAAELEARFDARLAERTRIARELHDTLLTDMTALVMRLDAATAQPRTNGGSDTSLLTAARDQARRAIAEARRAVLALRDGDGESRPLVERLADAGRHIFHDTGIVTTIESSGAERRYSPTVESEVLRIAGEAMTNARRHARCRTVVVACAHGALELRVSVRDDGGGFDPAAGGGPGHVGLAGMRERAAAIGATLTVESAIGMGTSVTVVAPADTKGRVP